MKYIILLLLLMGCATNLEEAPLEDVQNLASVDVYPVDVNADAGNPLEFKTTLLNTGRGSNFDVKLTYLVLTKTGGEVLSEEETIKLEVEKIMDKSIDLPNDLEPGSYDLKVIAEFDGKQDDDHFVFQVDASQIVEQELELDAPAPVVNETVNESVEASETVDVNETEDTDVVNETDESEPTEQAEADGAIEKVVIEVYKFIPDKLTIKVGTTLEWTNNDAVSQTVTGAGFDSGTLAPDGVFKHKFTKKGIYSYSSTYSDASGVIEVVE